MEAAITYNTKDLDNFIYSGWGIGFPEGDIARNVIIFGVDISGSVHASYKTKDFLVLDRGLIQMIKKTTVYAEKMYSPNFSVESKIFVLSLDYNGDNFCLFVNGQKVTQFTAKDSIINNQNQRVLTLGTLTTASYPSGTNNRLSPKNINDTKLYGNVYDVPVDYNHISNEMYFNECKARPKIINVNNNEPVFYPYSINVNKCSGSCSNINDSYAKLCVPDIIKNINVKVFNQCQESMKQDK